MKKALSIDRLCGPDDCKGGEDDLSSHSSGDSGLHEAPATLPFATRLLMLIPNIDAKGSLMAYGFSNKPHR